MRVKQRAGKLINAALSRFGYELRATTSDRQILSMQAALSRRVLGGSKIGTVIDIGASNGSWSRMAQRYFSDAFYFLIEANACHAQALSEFKSQNFNYE